MKLTNYFSILDQYEHWVDHKKDDKYYFTFIVESQHLKHKHLAFNSKLQPVSLCVEYAEKDFLNSIRFPQNFGQIYNFYEECQRR